MFWGFPYGSNSIFSWQWESFRTAEIFPITSFTHLYFFFFTYSLKQLLVVSQVRFSYGRHWDAIWGAKYSLRANICEVGGSWTGPREKANCNTGQAGGGIWRWWCLLDLSWGHSWSTWPCLPILWMRDPLGRVWPRASEAQLRPSLKELIAEGCCRWTLCPDLGLQCQTGRRRSLYEAYSLAGFENFHLSPYFRWIIFFR